MDRRRSSLGDVPEEILDHILSFLDDEDFISITNDSSLFHESVKRLICRGKKLSITGRYGVKEESLVSFLTRHEFVKRKLRHVDLNHCYWFGLNVYQAVVRLENLRHLHVIDCKLSSRIVVAILGLKLISLSISWTWNWLMNLESSRRKMCDPDWDCYPELFISLKHLVIYIPGKAVGPGKARSDCFADSRINFLQYCTELESLKMYDVEPVRMVYVNKRAANEDWFSNKLSDEPFLPKLRSLVLDFYRNCNHQVEFVMRIFFKKRQNVLNELFLGSASHLLLEADMEIASRIIPFVAAKDVSPIYFDHSSDRIEDRELLVWRDESATRYKMILLNSVDFRRSNLFLESLINESSRLSCLYLKSSDISIDNLSLGLTTVAKNCPYLTSLILTVPLPDGMSHSSVYKVIGLFKALKALHLTEPWLMCGDVYDTVDPNIFESVMKSCLLYELTQSCKEIEEVRIWIGVGPDFINEHAIVSQVVLACISYWEKLRHLHLVGIQSTETEFYLPYITKNCRHLRTLSINHQSETPFCHHLLTALKSAHSLKDLRIFGCLSLSTEVCDSLGCCINLERLYADTLLLPTVPITCYEDLFSKLSKLTAVWFQSLCYVNEKDMDKQLFVDLEKLQDDRPPFFYCLNRVSNYTSNSFPVIHQEMMLQSFIC